MRTEQLFEAIPGKIKTAVYLVYASLILRFLRTLLTTGGRQMLGEPGLLTVAISIGLLMCLVGYKIGQGKNWARITFLIWAMWDLIAYPIFIKFLSAYISYPVFISYIPASWTFTMLSILHLGIQLYVVFVIFSGGSKQWFSKTNLNPQMSPAS